MSDRRTILLIGASRGLGLGLAREYLRRGWHVVATVRDPDKAHDLRHLQQHHAGQLRIETLDVTRPDTAHSLARHLAGTAANVLFVVAGQATSFDKPVHDVPAESAAQEFLTNAWGPPTVAEALSGVLAPHGTYVFMTSVLGSLASARGGTEVYSASKAALNMFGIGFSKRHPQHPVLLMHPGWVKTDMGGQNAPLDVETSARGMADVVEAYHAKPGVHYVDYSGKTLPW